MLVKKCRLPLLALYVACFGSPLVSAVAIDPKAVDGLPLSKHEIFEAAWRQPLRVHNELGHLPLQPPQAKGSLRGDLNQEENDDFELINHPKDDVDFDLISHPKEDVETLDEAEKKEASQKHLEKQQTQQAADTEETTLPNVHWSSQAIFHVVKFLQETFSIDDDVFA